MSATFFMRSLVCCLALLHGRAQAQPAYSGPPGAEVFQKAQQAEAAGNRTAAAALYQQAYAAYRSVDDSNGMTQALARQKALAGGAGVATRPGTAAPAAPVRLAGAVGAAPALLPGSTAGGRPVGLFFFMDVFNNQKVYYFTPAGQFYVNPVDFSSAGLAALPASQRGRYAITGKQMTFTLAGGGSTTGTYHFDPTGFSCEGSFMCVGPLAGARQLVGTFEGRNAAVRIDANTLAAFRTLAFKADGTFTRDNFAASHSESHHADSPSFTTDATATAAQQAGRWRLDGWYLTLADARGTTRGVVFRTDWDEKTDRTIRLRFDGTSYSATARP